jgi:hypothetical protein
MAGIGCGRHSTTSSSEDEMLLEMRHAQDAVVRTVASTISEPWERVVINFEMAPQEDGEGFQHDMLGFYIVKDSAGEFAKREFKFTSDVERAFSDLNSVSLRANKKLWTTCDMVLDSNGKYTMNFSFEPPKRINGILDEESYYRFSKYLKEYAASRK